ncbi:DNA binding protein, putative isoform 2 [Hibiscus syriacus]|uniref:DNA binding protein, putative isoform 2 n=1 Tax=Hibiscus syriacus TaxID=106335 RepID=A0A6A3CCT2_HIBSY|nr:DNA binding protein, putative isoform 2 [Hibiscus syriacus]
MEEPQNDGPGAKVSVFDDSIENHFRAMYTVSKICEEPKNDDLDETDMQRFSSSITFLREWRHFNYEPRVIRFANEKDVFGGVELPQFSSSTVSKGGVYERNASAEFCKDFVMYVGGSVWALDWCLRVHQNPNNLVKCEFIAIAAHPPESYYHKLGAPLIGRDMIQIWCVLNDRVNEEEASLSEKKPKRKYQITEALDESLPKKPRGRPRKERIDEPLPDKVKRLQGRPRKKPIVESPGCDPHVQPLAVQYPEDSMQLVCVEDVPGNTKDVPVKNHRKKPKGLKKEASTSVETPKTSRKSVKSKNATAPDNVLGSNSFKVSPSYPSIPGYVALPRAVLCLAHNGKVAWDINGSHII